METLVGINQESAQSKRRDFQFLQKRRTQSKSAAKAYRTRMSYWRHSIKREQPKQQIAAVEQIIKSYEQFKEPEKQLQPIVVAIENAAARNQKMHPELAFELIMARDDLLARVPSLHTTHVGLTLSKLIVDEEKRLTSILPNLPAAKEKRVLQALPAALGTGWTERALHLMEASHGRMVAQIPRILNETGQHAELRTMLERSIREHSATSEMLIWLCGEKEELGRADYSGFAVGDSRRAGARTAQFSRSRQQVATALVDDRELLGEMFKKGRCRPGARCDAASPVHAVVR